MDILRLNEIIHYTKALETTPDNRGVILGGFVHLESLDDEDVVTEYPVQTKDVYVWDGGVYQNKEGEVYTLSMVDRCHIYLSHQALLAYAPRTYYRHEGILEIHKSHTWFEQEVQRVHAILTHRQEEEARMILEIYYLLYNGGYSALAKEWLEEGHLGPSWPQKIVISGSDTEHLCVQEYLKEHKKKYGTYQKMLSFLKMNASE